MEKRKHLGLRVWMALVASLVLSAASLMFVQGVSARAEEPEFEGQVVGGTDVPNDKYPFMAALRDIRYGSNPYQQQFCGGTLIDRNSILTAAHCVSGASPRPLRVTVGRTVLTSSQGETRRVSRIFVHPKYNDRRNAYDVAVLKLKSPVEDIEPIKPAGRRQNFLEREWKPVIVAGWGATAQSKFGTRFPNRMHEARIPVRSDSFGRSAHGSYFVSKLMVAAGKDGKSACFGDSGGPIFKKVNGSWRQIGITSFGPSRCGARGYPGVYAEVNNYSIRDFILKSARR